MRWIRRLTVVGDAGDAGDRDGGCDASYFRAIPFGIVRRVATINGTPFTTS
jgi:hypothetical protein